MAAVNQLAIDGGSVFKELHSGVWVVIVSQSKFTMDYVPQSGDDGDSVTIGKKEATGLLEDMRKRAAWIKSALGLKKDDAMLCIYENLLNSFQSLKCHLRRSLFLIRFMV